MHLNTRLFPTTGYARELLFMFIRRELGGMVQDVYFSLHTVSLVLVQPRMTRPFITERLLMGRKESNQTKSFVNIVLAQSRLPYFVLGV